VATVQPSAPRTEGDAANGLRRNALGVLGVVAIVAAFMGPASSVYFGSFAAMSKAGASYAFALILAIVGCLLIAHAIAEFSRKIPTSGMAYTFATATFGPRAGFMTGWVVLAGYIPVFSLLSAAMGFLSEQFCKTYFHVSVPWWIFTTLSILAVMFICNSGVSRSSRVILGFLIFEVGVFAALFLTIVIKGGAHGNTLAPFSPTNSISGLTGIGYGILWGYWMFFGFESAGTLGEETQNPRRNVPRALFVAVFAIGAFYVFSAYAGAIGFGIHSDAFTTETSPWDTLSRMYWGTHIGWLVLLTVINSTFAIMMSAFNSTVRIFYSMGREKVLPSTLGTIDPVSRVPKRAGTYYAMFTLALVLIAGLTWGPINYWLFAGVLGAMGLILAFILVNVCVIFYYWRNHRAEFSWWRHALLPFLGAVIAFLPLYGAVWPVPAFPMNLVPYVFLAWVVGGALYLVYAIKRRPHVLEGMGRAFASNATSDPAREST
jgi:amino acid transporter